VTDDIRNSIPAMPTGPTDPRNRREDIEIASQTDKYSDGASERRSHLEVAAHPVTRVYCDELGIIRFERQDADPIVLAPGDPKRSRVAALRRVEAILEPFHGDENDPMRKFPISDTGVGISYDGIREETIRACEKSKRIEKERKQKFEDKMRKYKLA